MIVTCVVRSTPACRAGRALRVLFVAAAGGAVGESEALPVLCDLRVLSVAAQHAQGWYIRVDGDASARGAVDK